jgi:hypothetical protein
MPNDSESDFTTASDIGEITLLCTASHTVVTELLHGQSARKRLE